MPMFEYIANKKGAIFDLDGTIADTEIVWDKAVDDTAKQILRLDYLDMKNIERGLSIYDKWSEITKYYKKEGVAELEALVQQTYANLFEALKDPDLELTVKDGFWNLVHELKFERNFKIAIATNTFKVPAKELMGYLEIEGVFDFEIFGDDVSRHKPNPEIYNKAAKALELKHGEIIIFEDSMTGAQAAEKADIECVILMKKAESVNIEKFPKNCVDFMFDFSYLPGNIGKEYKDIVLPKIEDTAI